MLWNVDLYQSFLLHKSAQFLEINNFLLPFEKWKKKSEYKKDLKAHHGFFRIVKLQYNQQREDLSVWTLFLLDAVLGFVGKGQPQQILLRAIESLFKMHYCFAAFLTGRGSGKKKENYFKVFHPTSPSLCMGIFLEWICYLERRRGMGQLLLRIFKDFSEFSEIYKAKEKISVGSRKRAFRKSCPQESVRSRKRVLKKAGAQGGGRLRKRALKKACAQESMPAGKRARKKACLRLART